MFYYKFNIGDYASHTRHLSPIEDIAYRRLMDIAYTTEKPITPDLREISRLINLREYQQEISDVLKEFWVLVEEGWINNRVLKEIEDTGKKSEKASSSAKARWESMNNANASKKVCERNANASKDDAIVTKNDATHNPLPITQDTNKKQTQKALLASLGIDGQLADDFISLRNQKKAAITETALKGIQREAEKANISTHYAVEMMCERGWVGFKAEWVKTPLKTNSVQDARLTVAQQIWGTQNANNGSFIDINSAGSTEGIGASIPKALVVIR